MTNKGMLIVGIGVLLLAGGLFALWNPVSIDAYDQWGFQIGCGSGIAADTAQAATADQTHQTTDFVNQCGSALTLRRAWSIPAVALGALILLWVVGQLLRHSNDMSQS